MGYNLWGGEGLPLAVAAWTAFKGYMIAVIVGLVSIYLGFTYG